MAVRVDENLAVMGEVMSTGESDVLAVALSADDEIDAMNVSLTERCYDLLRRESPVASDLRFVVSVLRVIAELERIGDLALRVILQAPQQHLLASNDATFTILQAMAQQVVRRYRQALRAWATMDLTIATELALEARSMDRYYEDLMSEIMSMNGAEAVPVAVATFAAGRSIERIGDHASIIGARLRYLITGDPSHLVAEVR